MKQIILILILIITSCSPMITQYKKYEIKGVASTNNVAVRDIETNISTIITNKNIYNNYRFGLVGFGRGDIVKVEVGEIKKSELKKQNRKK